MPKMKPMLAAQFEPHRVQRQLPVYGQPKLDGIRMLIKDGVGYSRSLKPIPNQHVQEEIRRYARILEGFDGELIVGEPTDSDVYRQTNSAVMSHGGKPDFSFYAFDLWDQPNDSFHQRMILMSEWLEQIGSQNPVPFMQFLECRLLESMDAITRMEEDLLGEGHEGLILRGPNGLYKFGRATPAQGQLIKVKRFKDAEAVVHGFEELMHNANEATTNELGLTSRSSHQANKIGRNTLGALVCVGEYPDGTPYDVKIGTGFDQAQRQEIWDNQDSYFGCVVKFKYFEVGQKDAPRHPVFLGWRTKEDT